MVACFEEIDQWIENMERGHEICSLRSIHEYIECARKNNLEARYFPVISCGFIVYMDKIIFLALEKGGTRLSIDPIAT